MTNSNRPLALITGASSGIGTELAKVFVSHGYDLIISARRQQKLDSLAEQLRQIGSDQGSAPQVLTFAVDLAKRRGPAKLMDFVLDQSRPLEALVNNAGNAFQGDFTSMSDTQVHDLMALNMRATTELTHRALPSMLDNGSGRILNIASIVGFQAIPTLSLYSASKAFVLSFSEAMSEELRGCGVKVCAVCPGLTQTEMVKDLGTDQVPLSDLFIADPASVAADAYRAMQRGDTVHVTGCLNQAAVAWSDLQPRWFKRTIAGIAGRLALQNISPAP